MKLHYALAALLVAGATGMAAIAPIESSNEVGITPVATLDGGLATILAVPFEACLGDGAAGTLADLVSTLGLVSAAANAEEADQLVVLVDDGGLKYNYYWNKTGEGWTPMTGTELMPDGSSVARNPGPADEFQLARGLGFWLKRPTGASGSVYLQGQIADGAQETAIVQGLNLVGIAALDGKGLNQVDWTGATVGVNAVNADMIMIPNSSGQLDSYSYVGSGESAEWVQITKQGRVAAEGAIPAGQGFWYKSVGSGFTFKPDGE